MIRHVFGIANNQAVIARSLGLHGDLAKRIVLLPPDPMEFSKFKDDAPIDAAARNMAGGCRKGTSSAPSL
jgi:hypothetical protein